MDEEDMADFGIAPKQVRATAAFESQEGKRGRAAAQDESRAVRHLDDLLRPSREDIGHRWERGGAMPKHRSFLFSAVSL
jgi:hypothetical protein